MICTRSTRAFLWALAAFAGCDTSGPRSTTNATTASSAADEQAMEQSSLDAAFNFLSRPEEFERSNARSQATYHLNRWIERQKPNTTWQRDPLVDRLPAPVRAAGGLDALDGLRFSPSDADYVMEALTLRDVGRWVARRKPDPEFTAWLDRHPDLGPARRPLATAFALFDWTIRNVQLDRFPAPPSGATPPVASQGQPGPGYTLLPWQALYFGHGDAWQRARVFLLLCRQQGLDGVVLATVPPSAAVEAASLPWLPAVWIGGKLYLFDTTLGLPLPSADGGVLSLEELRADPERLASLDVGSSHRYPVRPNELSRLVALADAAPPALSLRMRLLESRLAAADQLSLTVRPSDLAERLKAAGLDRVELWPLPIAAMLYAESRPGVLAKDRNEALQHFRQFGLMERELTPLARGRWLFLRGQFEPQDEKPGAKSHFLEARYPQEMIQQIATDKSLQESLGLMRLPNEPDASWQNRIAQMQRTFAQAKHYGSFWLGQIQVELGQSEVAVEWLERRTLGTTPDGDFAPAVRYNLARTFESLGRADEARQIYLGDDSPQAHGNLLRARWLRERQNK